MKSIKKKKNSSSSGKLNNTVHIVFSEVRLEENAPDELNNLNSVKKLSNKKPFELTNLVSKGTNLRLMGKWMR